MSENKEPTTTHAAWGAGDPQLLVSGGNSRLVFDLTEDRVRIGSAPDCELQLDGIDPLHATVDHDDRDEYVLTLLGAGEMNANPTSAGTAKGENTETLRTGARFTAGEWTFVFQRAEFADHGRPAGGREGGEFSEQEGQPERPGYPDGGPPAGAAPTGTN